MLKVAVNSDVLRWAIDRSGRTSADLAPRFPRITDWAAGTGQPTLRQLESLAKATSTPLGFFFLSKPPEERLPVPHFRTVRKDSSAPSPELLDTIRTMEQRQAWMREFLTEEGHGPLPYVASIQVGKQEDTAIAKSMRDALGLKENWASGHRTWTDALRALREAMDEAGILVVVNGIVGNNTHRKLDPSEFRGFVLVDEYAPLVFANGTDGKAAQMFTFAHELAHIFFGSSAAFDLRQLLPADDATELACNRVAAEFLVPERLLRQAWPEIHTQADRFQELAQRFKVSEIVAARRVLDLRLISRDAFLAFYNAYRREERRSGAQQTGGGNFYFSQNLRVGYRFFTAVVRAARERKLLYSEAYRLTGLYGRAFTEYAARLGIRGR